MERERLGSRLGFIFLSAGCAIGCGNVWKFPWMVGENGGAAFVLVYLLCIFILGLPALTMEFAIGRRAQRSITRMYNQIEKPGQKWHLHGYLALFGNFCLMAFYTVVTGWILHYFVRFLTGDLENLGFVNMITNPTVNVTYLIITLILAFTVLMFRLQGGLERITKYLMGMLLLLLLVLAVKSGMLEGAKEGYRFYLIPDFSKINLNVVVAAMNQAFFTLGIGVGSMAIFGSYIGKERSLLGESVNVICLDLVVAFVAGLIIFPTCFSYDLEVGAGPALLFDTMATAFLSSENGRIWGTLFFLFMTFAAFSTVLAVCENILACIRDLTGWSRKKGCLICGLLVFAFAITTALGYSVWQFQPFAEGTAWLDFWDFILSYNLLPIGALVTTFFCTNKRFGWGWDGFVEEANQGKGLKVTRWMRPLFTIVVPILVLVIYLVGLKGFQWK